MLLCFIPSVSSSTTVYTATFVDIQHNSNTLAISTVVRHAKALQWKAEGLVSTSRSSFPTLGTSSFFN